MKITAEKLVQIIKEEKEKFNGQDVYTDKRRAAEEMLSMMGKTWMCSGNIN